MLHALPLQRLLGQGEHPLRFGLVGAGTHGRGAVIPAFLRSNRCQLVAVADANSEHLSLLEGLPLRGYRSLDEMLAHEGLDAVYIATLPVTHCAIARRCFDEGLHVICEKPLAASAEEAEEMALAAEAAGRRLLVMFENRFKHHFSKVREWIGEGAIGRVEAIHAQQFGRHPSAQPRRKHLLDAAGCLDCGIHLLDMVRYWLDGGEWQEIHAKGVWFGEEVDNPPHIAISARLDQQVLVTFENSFSYGVRLNSAPWNFSRDTLTILGTEGVIVDGICGGTACYELISDSRRESAPILRTNHVEEIVCVLDEFSYELGHPEAPKNPRLAWAEDGVAAQVIVDGVNTQCRATRLPDLPQLLLRETVSV